MAGYFPKMTNPLTRDDFIYGASPELLGQMAQDEAQQMFPVEPASYQKAPNARLLGLNLSGSGLDAAATSVQQALQDMPMPAGAGFGTGLLRGLVGGVSGARAGQAMSRQKANAVEDERVKREQEYQRRAVSDSARSLRNHQLTLRQKAFEAGLKGGAGDDGTVLLTEGLWSDAKRNKIAIPREFIGQRIKRDKLMRDMPVADGLTATQLRAQNDADIVSNTAQGIVDFSIDPRRVARDHNFRAIEIAANDLLKKNGSRYNLQQLQQLKKSAEDFDKVMNNQRFTGFRQAAATTVQHMNQLAEAYKEFAPRMQNNIVAINMGFYAAAKSGLLGGDAQAKVLDLAPVAEEALPTEIATVLAGGRAPYKDEIAAAHKKYVAPWLNSRSFDAQTKSVKKILRARIQSQLDANPFFGGDKADNPYLLDKSPIKGWDESDAQTSYEQQTPSLVPNGGMYGSIKDEAQKAKGGNR